jgi:ATP adenylyltransferase
VTEASSAPAGCIFCDALARGENEPLLIHRGRRTFVILNKFPYNNGHLMVVPNRHVASLVDTNAEELAEMMAFARDAEIALHEAYQPQGINVGINLGRPAGAGIIDHIHVHLVPRWTGDTNFMTAVGDTRVLPEDLAATASRLRPIFEKLANSGG